MFIDGFGYFSGIYSLLYLFVFFVVLFLIFFWNASFIIFEKCPVVFSSETTEIIERFQ